LQGIEAHRDLVGGPLGLGVGQWHSAVVGRGGLVALEPEVGLGAEERHIAPVRALRKLLQEGVGRGHRGLGVGLALTIRRGHAPEGRGLPRGELLRGVEGQESGEMALSLGELSGLVGRLPREEKSARDELPLREPLEVVERGDQRLAVAPQEEEGLGTTVENLGGVRPLGAQEPEDREGILVLLRGQQERGNLGPDPLEQLLARLGLGGLGLLAQRGDQEFLQLPITGQRLLRLAQRALAVPDGQEHVGLVGVLRRGVHQHLVEQVERLDKVLLGELGAGQGVAGVDDESAVFGRDEFGGQELAQRGDRALRVAQAVAAVARAIERERPRRKTQVLRRSLQVGQGRLVVARQVVAVAQLEPDQARPGVLRVEFEELGQLGDGQFVEAVAVEAVGVVELEVRRRLGAQPQRGDREQEGNVHSRGARQGHRVPRPGVQPPPGRSGRLA